MKTEVTWPVSLTADSTFSDEIGAISAVEFSSFEDSFKDAWNKAHKKIREKIMEKNPGIIAMDVINRSMLKLENTVEPLIEGFKSKFDLDNYIVTSGKIILNISHYGSGNTDNIKVRIDLQMCHKDDFINICTILNSHSDEIVTKAIPILSNDGEKIYKFDNTGVSGDSTYTLLHDWLTCNLDVNFDEENVTSEDIVNSLLSNGSSLRVWTNYTGKNFNAHSYMGEIYKGLVLDNSYLYTSNYSISTFYGASAFGTYGSSTKTIGQPDSGEADTGGDGDGDNESDNIDVPPLPAIGAVNSGMVTLFNPVLMEIKELASYLWDHDIWTQLNKMFQKPMDAVISLNLCNIKPQIAGEKQGVFVGGFNTNVQMSLVTKQYVEVDCGSIDIKKYWGNFMDYNPHTKIELYLPFIGFTNIDTDNVMGKKLAVKYYVDLLTGTCQCYVSVIDGDYNAILYTYTGNCFTQIPISSGNYDAMKQTLMFAIGGVAIGAVTAGTGAVASSIGGITSVSGLQTAAGTSITSGIASKAVAGASKGGLKGCAVSSVMGSKSGIHRSGNASSASALMNYKKPYLIITRPSQSLPVDYNKFNGYPSNITSKLSDLKGYTEVETVHVEGFNCTDDEKDMIEGLLKNGVFL